MAFFKHLKRNRRTAFHRKNKTNDAAASASAAVPFETRETLLRDGELLDKNNAIRRTAQKSSSGTIPFACGNNEKPVDTFAASTPAAGNDRHLPAQEVQDNGSASLDADQQPHLIPSSSASSSSSSSQLLSHKQPPASDVPNLHINTDKTTVTYRTVTAHVTVDRQNSTNANDRIGNETATPDSSTEGSSSNGRVKKTVATPQHTADTSALSTASFLSPNSSPQCTPPSSPQKQNEAHAEPVTDIGRAQSPVRDVESQQQPSDTGTMKVLPSTPLQNAVASSVPPHALADNDNAKIPDEVVIVSETMALGQVSNDIYAALEAAQIENSCRQVRIQELETLVQTLQAYLTRTQMFCETLLDERRTLAKEVDDLEQEHLWHCQRLNILKLCMGTGVVVNFVTGSPYLLTLSVILFLAVDTIFNHLV